jgi:hypothetical protein
VEQKSLLFIFSSAATQRTACGEVQSQMAAHLRTAVHCRLGRLLDSNPGLQFYNLVSLPMSHHCSLSHIEPLRYRTYQIPKLSDTEPIRYLTYQILNLSDTEPIGYRTYQILNLSDTEPIRY